MHLDVEIIVRVRPRRRTEVLREVTLDGLVSLNGTDEHEETATVEAAVRALEEAGSVTRRIVGHLPYMTDCQIFYNRVDT